MIEQYYFPKGAFDTDIAGADIAFLIVETVVYMLLVFLIEKLSTIPKFLLIFSKYIRIMNYNRIYLKLFYIIN